MMVRVPIPARANAEEHLKARADAERFYRLHGFEVLPSMAGEIVLRIPATCQHLVTGDDSDIDYEAMMDCGGYTRTYSSTCAIYETRPEICRTFVCSKCRGDQ
jgi:Fe-S-cluster containining protein